VIFTTSENRNLFGLWLVCAASIFMWACTADQPSKTDAHPNRVPVAVGETVQVVEKAPEPPKPSPKEQDEAPAPDDPPFYGSTMYEGIVTSVYYYPKGPNSQPGQAMTHVKFNHHEEQPEEIWLCGDRRNQFEVGNKYRLRVSFEPNEACITNWTTK
jgi:hypothetical protein